MKLDPSLITRFLNNACDAEERALVAQYLHDHPDEMERYLGEAEWMDLITQEQAFTPRSAAMKQAVMQAISTTAPKTRRVHYRRLAVAAMLCVLVSVSGFLWWQQRQAGDSGNSAPVAAAMITITNPLDTVKAIRMQDGSLVLLEGRSTIQFPEDFRHNRQVLLQGDALFDVAKNEAHPFRVHTGKLDITVLGTRFFVYADKAGEGTNIKLFSGRIRIGTPAIAGTAGKEIDLLPGKEFRYQQGTWAVQSFGEKEPAVPQPATQRQVEETAPAAVNGLVFENQRLTTVLAALEAHFGVPLHYPQKELRQYYFSGEFTANDSLSHILNTISALNGLQVKEDSTGFTLSAVKP
ncbi:FecR domain-containing protein [Chitinophaga japonensis]|uniref:FecR family protein n=1 Tax=Chitinophaga japonensis TaxID=104662 RepID=A0A562TFZ2_CHIJA|nr:FecR domain-containing protein [Chitinophaga japonensis]TWI92006.1 FecR family protein [Chitinophaga japonensis]